MQHSLTLLARHAAWNANAGWHQWTFTDLAPPPDDDPWPPVSNVKPSLPQCNP